MSSLIAIHIITGLAGIAFGLAAVVGILCRKRMARSNAGFVSMTAAACGTGFVFLPSGGVTSAQLVAFFTTFLLGVAAYARYARGLEGSWGPIYALAAVGALFLNSLITVAQSFFHIHLMRALAPTQHSFLYVAVKAALLLIFIPLALVAVRRAGSARSETESRGSRDTA